MGGLQAAYKVLSHRPNWITKVRNKLSAYLSHQQKLSLGDRQPPPSLNLLL